MAARFAQLSLSHHVQIRSSFERRNICVEMMTFLSGQKLFLLVVDWAQQYSYDLLCRSVYVISPDYSNPSTLNPSWSPKRSFSKRSSNGSNLNSPAFIFVRTKTFCKWSMAAASRKRWRHDNHVIFLTEASTDFPDRRQTKNLNFFFARKREVLFVLITSIQMI